MARTWTTGTYDYVLDDTVDNYLELRLPSKLIFRVEFEYTPGTADVRYLRGGDPGYPGEAPEVNILAVTLNHIAVFGGCGLQAYRDPTVKEQATAELWLAEQLRKDDWPAADLRAEILKDLGVD